MEGAVTAGEEAAAAAEVGQQPPDPGGGRGGATLEVDNSENRQSNQRQDLLAETVPTPSHSNGLVHFIISGTP